ncbi:Vacuolar protein sorting-associated protein 62 [Coniosporium apollinis]|uniref:Vacuolar protein sorting-associated protein 62 n=1 Tax=Coniosporium apollinis TaxID=61459 RepID=A0ABQ9NV89_9PEZI|nr:Vacuolar protein sorting-associated protein 62 [Coniosporium apollinis]
MAVSLATISGLYQNLGPRPPPLEGAQEARWIASSNSWIDRKACKWFGVCGASHLSRKGWTSKISNEIEARKQGLLGGDPNEDEIDLSDFWTSGKSRPEDWSQDERVLREIPKFVFEYAPLVHLYSGEQFWPCDIAEHLLHTRPYRNYTPIYGEPSHNLTDLDSLNKYGRWTYLQSVDNVEDRPHWLGGEQNIPSTPHSGDGDDDENHWPGRKLPENELPNHGANETWYDVGIGDTEDKGGVRPLPADIPVAIPIDGEEGEQLVHSRRKRSRDWRMDRKTAGGRSDAPAVLVVVDKGNNVTDAFWFYFYSYNLGNVVLNVRFGNHVGDWEHSVIRFQNGEPKAIFWSEHNLGQAYTYDAAEKIAKRPVGYIATGTHAMYASPGAHPYVLPWGLLHDQTDRGPLWDPLLNTHAYTYDYLNDTLRASTRTPLAPTNWFYFAGHWGDKFYPLSDPRQYRFAGQYHYVTGPLGPRFKNLGRQRVCQGNMECRIRNWIGPGGARRWEGLDDGDEVSEKDVKEGRVEPENET